jgi:hypothetical protein
MVYLSIPIVNYLNEFLKINNGQIKKEIVFGLISMIIIEIVIVRYLKHKTQ